MSAAIIYNNKLEIKEDTQKVKKDKKDKKDNISKLNMIVLEFIEENTIPPKRTNSMQSLRPHSHTINSKTTRDSSVKEDNQNLNLNINQLLLSNDVNDNNRDSNKKKEINSKNNSEKNPINIYSNIFTKEEQENTEKKVKGKAHLRSKSINLLREMNPFYKDEVEAEGYSIIKNKDKKISFIYPDILLKKIIFEDFIKKNILLIHHFCEQCFCFLNKEIFFRKIFYCYNFYKKNTSKEKLKNLIDFINILVIEMFQYYQKIDLNDIYVTHIKKYYNELITDLILSMDNYIDNNNNNNDNNEDDDCRFRFESIDYSKNEQIINRNSYDSNANYNYIINRKNLINMNLNIEIKDVKIFIFKEKENLKKEKIKEKEKNKEIENENKNKKQYDESNNIFKSLTFRPSSVQNIKGNILFKEDVKTERSKKNSQNVKTTKSEKEIFLWNLEEVQEKEIEQNIDINKEKEKEKEKEKDNKTNKEQNEEKEKEKKQKLFKISKTLRKSNIISIKKAIHDAIIEEEDDIKDKSEEETKSLYSLKSNSPSKKSSSSSSSRIESENESDKNEENSNKNISIFNFDRKNTKGKEEDNKQKLEIIKNILHKSDTPDNLLSLNEKILNELKYILFLFDKETNGEPGYIDINDAKDHIIFYKNLQNILNKQKKVAILPHQAQKRLTKSYSSIFNLGSFASRSKTRDYLKKGYFCVTDWKTEEIGNQLMKVSKSLLSKIHPRELYKAIFLKKEKEKTSPNVVDCINIFNRLTSFIIEDILSYDYPRDRARIYEKWVDIADYCKNNKDYNDLIAIFSALNHYVITGLQLTLKEVRSRANSIFRNISDFCSVEGNYRKIREDMNNCDKNGIVYIPYLGMLMRDINFFEESSKYINENGCINIEKIEKIQELFENCFKFKDVPDKKNKIKELHFFEELEDISEEALEEMANKLEPEFILDDIQKPGKRPTTIDKIFFEDYKMNMRDINLSGRKTTFFK